jgi:hypothetical protein
MAQKDGTQPGILPDVFDALEARYGRICGAAGVRSVAGIGAEVDQREEEQMKKTESEIKFVEEEIDRLRIAIMPLSLQKEGYELLLNSLMVEKGQSFVPLGGQRRD